MRKYKVYYAPVKVHIRKAVSSQPYTEIPQQTLNKGVSYVGSVGSDFLETIDKKTLSKLDVTQVKPLKKPFGSMPNPEPDPPAPDPLPTPDPPPTPPPESPPKPPTPGGSLVSGVMYFGLRFQSNLISMENIYKKLGLQTLEELNRLTTGQTRPPTCIELSSQSDGIKLGLLKTFKISLIPKDKEKTLPPYNDKYTTRVPASGGLSDRKIATVLYSTEFKFPNTPEPISYIVEPGSVRVVRGRKNTGKISFF